MSKPASYPDTPALNGPFVFLDDSVTPAPRFYHSPQQIIRADHPDEIEAVFAHLTQAHKNGAYLAGYVSYDLGLWLEPKTAHLLPKSRSHPLICFGVFNGYEDSPPAELLYTAAPPDLRLTPMWSQADYLARFKRVQDYLRAGDCYQINLTFPMQGQYSGDPIQLYAGLRHRQKAKYGGFIRLGGPDLLSLSPELFFKKTGGAMSMRPMKGTLKRDPDPAADKRLRAAMADDLKSRAENLMIVDLLRNDLSRLSKPGSVKVPELFALETYPTLHQMTSRVVSELNTDASFRDLFNSLFPCGSVTGAPKIRAMEIIDELESGPRGAYCGGMGYVDPNGDACFNVGIRSLSLSGKAARYHVGSGVVLDSRGEDEYAECLLKADVLRAPPAHFIETVYYDSAEGYRHIGRHIARLARAAKMPQHMDAALDALARYNPVYNPARVKLTLGEDGTAAIMDSPFIALKTPLRLAISKYALTATRQETAHKSSRRDFYDGERARISTLNDCDEILFLNKDNQLCEGSFTSLFIEKNGQIFTPQQESGLLPGILRADMLASGQAVQAVLTRDDLLTADHIFMGNSLRGLMAATVISWDQL